jgi:phosphatidylglycerol---prolipoprotein diacylglyceryl transferase
MHPELFTIPFVNMSVKSYGFMLMLGFLTAIWIGMRLAERRKASPDVILNCGVLCLFFGVAGARLFYVAHYWRSNFAFQPRPILAALNITSGGLEYLGGVIGAVLAVIVYLALYGRWFARREPRLSVRLYLDLLAPIAMWGLAFGRAGCFLNGCCWGGLCTDPHTHQALPWGVTFPFSSGAQERQWLNRQVTVPAELIWDEPDMTEVTVLLPKTLLETPPEALRGLREFEEARAELLAAQAKGVGGDALQKLEQRAQALQKTANRLDAGLRPLAWAQIMPSRRDPSRPITVSELNDLAGRYRSLPVHPVQAYDIINALLLSGLLVLILQRRTHHGVVLGWMLVLYPLSRYAVEVIRVDNPHDVGGLTISQAFGLGVFLCGLVWLWVNYRVLPPRSPVLVPWVPPEATPPSAAPARR